MSQKAELAEVDAQYGDLAVGASGPDHHAVAAEHYLQIGVARFFGKGLALAQPGLHALGELDSLRLAWICEDAQPAWLWATPQAGFTH